MITTALEALTLPLRRSILEALRNGPMLVGELAERTGVPQAVMSKQLRVLRDAGFVRVTVDAQRRWYELCPEPFVEVAEWLDPYRGMWEDRLDRLGMRLDVMEEGER